MMFRFGMEVLKMFLVLFFTMNDFSMQTTTSGQDVSSSSRQLVGTKLLRRNRRRASSCDPDRVVPLVAYVGQEVELQCRRCSQTTSKTDFTKLQWRTQSRTAASEEVIDVKMALLKKYSIEYEDMALRMKSITKEQSGKYYCNEKGKYLSNYDVTVLTKPEFHLVIPSEGQQPYPDDKEGDTLLMYSKWGEWSSCNHCGSPGQHVRIGYCYAMVLLEQFPEGVPCRSGVVPYSKRNLFNDRKDEKMVDLCNIPCPKGNLDSAKSGKDISYIPFGMAKPTLPAFISRKAIYADEGSNIALACPTLDFEKAIRWQNGSTPLLLLDLRVTPGNQVTNTNRMFIDVMDVLHIRNLTMSDAAVYSCWQEDRNIVTIKIKVVEPLFVDEEIKGQLLYSGFVFAGIIVLMIGCGVFRNRNLVK